MPDIQPQEPAHKTQPARRADATRNRARILSVAKTLFAAHGAETVTTDDIRRTAGVGKGTLFRHFPTKSDLCLAVLEDEMSTFQHQATEAFARFEARDLAPLEQLEWLLEQILDFNDRHLGLLFESYKFSRVVPLETQYQLVFHCLEMAHRHQQIHGDHDLRVLADLLMSPLRAPMLRFYRQRRAYTTAAIGAELRRLVRTLRPTP